jgi:NAD(P)-dependent dehydrogenase (short-subunit alcohol dehydrogenase family)
MTVWRKIMKVLLITGASRGLGAAVARTAAGIGAAVVLNARSAAPLQKLRDEIKDNGGEALALPGDVGQLETCRRLIAESIAAFGRLDSLVNNAAVIDPIAPIATADPHGWQTAVAVNLLGPMWLTQAALPHLRRRQGRVINVSSGAADYGIPGWAAYCTTKGALNQFNRVLAEEEPAVTAVAVRPGVVDTAMQVDIRQKGATGMPEDAHGRFVELHRQGNLLPPEKPGRAIALLALHAPAAWSGRFLSWDDADVAALEKVSRL